MLRRITLAGAIVVLLTAVAAAQMPMPSISLGGDKRPLTPEEIARQKAIDKAYKAATQKIPDKKAGDPWGNVRSAPSASAKTH